MFGFLLCAFGRHSIARREVTFDTQYFRGPCRRCGTPLIKDEIVGWRRVTDADPAPIAPESRAHLTVGEPRPSG